MASIVISIVFVTGMITLCIAGVMEAVKGIWPGTKAKRWPLWLLAGWLSFGMGFVLAAICDFGLGWAIGFLYGAMLYCLQYIVDFAFLKKMVRRYVERLAGGKHD